jgi:hypothetical protein
MTANFHVLVSPGRVRLLLNELGFGFSSSVIASVLEFEEVVPNAFVCLFRTLTSRAILERKFGL